MRGSSPLYIEERHRALGRDATFSWSRALTHPPRCNRTRHRGRHLDFVGAAILVSWGPPSWTGSRGGRHLGPEVTSLTLKSILLIKRRQTRGIARKSRSTITRHQEDKLSKATSLLFPLRMINFVRYWNCPLSVNPLMISFGQEYMSLSHI